MTRRIVSQATKYCPGCNQTKTLDQFYRDKRRIGTPGEYRVECIECTKGARKERYDTEAERANKLEYNYRVSEEDYQTLLELQNSRCAGCNKHQADMKRKFVVDHDHATGMVRGLLCYGCNAILGQAKDNVQTLRTLAQYVEQGGFVKEAEY